MGHGVLQRGECLPNSCSVSLANCPFSVFYLAVSECKLFTLLLSPEALCPVTQLTLETEAYIPHVLDRASTPATEPTALLIGQVCLLVREPISPALPTSLSPRLAFTQG